MAATTIDIDNERQGGGENGERMATTAAPERDVSTHVSDDNEVDDEEEEEEEEDEVEEGGFAYEARVRNPAGFAAFVASVFRCGSVVMREEDQVEQLAEVRQRHLGFFLQLARCPAACLESCTAAACSNRIHAL